MDSGTADGATNVRNAKRRSAQAACKTGLPMSRKLTALILHVGAGRFPKQMDRARNIRKKLEAISAEAYQFLETHSAVETVVEIVRRLEDWPETNAGTGALLPSDGKARLSASLMDGSHMCFSGVINTEKMKNPILLAQLLQNERDRILTSSGAERFAREKGFTSIDPRTKESLDRWRALKKTQQKGMKYGTVGACALDRRGRLAAATSTGGRGMERVGRVSDSALPAGNFANSYAAVSATGLGEDIVEEALASTLVVRATDWKNLEKSFSRTFKEARKRKRRFAAIGLDRRGNLSWAHTTDLLYYVYHTPTRRGVFPFHLP